MSRRLGIASEPLKTLLVEQRKALSPAVVEYVRKTEIEGEFPFELLNDLRGYLNYAKFYFHGFLRLTEAIRETDHRDTIERLKPFFGFPSRIRRYFLLLVVGAYLDEGTTDEEHLEPLRMVAWAFQQRLRDEETSLPQRVMMVKAGSGFATLAAKQLTSTLFVLLREYVDYLFLAEHALGYQPYWPIRTDNEQILARSFFNVDYGDHLDWHEPITIWDAYDAEVPLQFNLFRGKVDGIPPFQAKRWTVVTGQDGHVLGLSEVECLASQVPSALERCKRFYEHLPTEELELQKMIQYSAELRNLLRVLGKEFVLSTEAKESVLQNTLGRRLKASLPAATYSDVFFAVLIDALDHFMRLLNEPLHE